MIFKALAIKWQRFANIRRCRLGWVLGLKMRETAAKVAKVADAVIVGSALVQLIENTEESQLISTLSQTLADIRGGIDNI